MDRRLGVVYKENTNKNPIPGGPTTEIEQLQQHLDSACYSKVKEIETSLLQIISEHEDLEFFVISYRATYTKPDLLAPIYIIFTQDVSPLIETFDAKLDEVFEILIRIKDNEDLEPNNDWYMLYNFTVCLIFCKDVLTQTTILEKHIQNLFELGKEYEPALEFLSGHLITSLKKDNWILRADHNPDNEESMYYPAINELIEMYWVVNNNLTNDICLLFIDIINDNPDIIYYIVDSPLFDGILEMEYEFPDNAGTLWYLEFIQLLTEDAFTDILEIVLFHFDIAEIIENRCLKEPTEEDKQKFDTIVGIIETNIEKYFSE